MIRQKSALVRAWNRIESIGVETLSDVAAKERAKLLNQWIAYGIGFGLLIMAMTAGIYFYIVWKLGLPQYGQVIPFYLVAEIPPVIVGFIAFVVHKYRPQWEVPMVWLYFISFAAVYFALALFMGTGAGIHYALLTVIFVFLALFPERPRHYLPLMGFQVIAFFVCTWLLLTRAPLFPLPEEITVLIFRIVVPFIIGFSLLAFFYVGLHYRFFSKVYRLWKKVTNLGNGHFDSRENKKSNEIVNAAFLSAILVGFLLVLITIVAVVLSTTGPDPGFVRNALIYFMMAAIFTSWSALLFYRKIKSGKNTLYQIAGAVSGILFAAVAALALGKNTYFYLLLYALMPLPLLFAGTSRAIVVFYVIVFAAIVAATTVLVHRTGAIMPLPAFMESALAWLNIVITGLFALMVIVYAWWKYNFNVRMRSGWQLTTRFGTTPANTPQQVKMIVLTNISIYVDLGVLLSVVIFTLIIYWKGYVPYAYYLPPAIISSLVLFIFFWVRLRGRSSEAMLVVIFFLSLLNGFILSIALGEAFNVHYFFYATLVVPYFVFNSTHKKWIAACNILSAAFIYAAFWHFHNYPPLAPPPPTEINGIIKNYVRLSINVFVVAAIATIAYYFWRESDLVEDDLEIAREKSESLLLNILPADIAHELKETGTTTPRLYENASVLFTDFVGFTLIAEKMSAEDLVGELDHCFSYFDGVMKKFHLEKIKTIGDSYMAAAGIPEPTQTHAIDCALAALEISAYMDALKEQKAAAGLESWDLRIGIHSGPLVAGVVGEKKFAYDCWGDTVNTASRMESSGAPGRVNVSRATWDLIKDFFEGENRGKVYAKRKGEVEMFFISCLKPEYAEQQNPMRPNGVFLRKLDAMRQGMERTVS